jgi:Membrane protein involved in the export of O-antigen and teichoic acid
MGWLIYRSQRLPNFVRYFDIEIGRKLLRDSLPLLLSSIATSIYMRIDQVMIKNMLGDREVGLYSAAIEHLKNGYLAKPFDTNDLKNGIEWILNTANYDELCKNAREKVLREFDSKIVAKKYIELYKELLENKL